MIESVLDIRNLSVSYATPRGTVQALRRINLKVPRAKVVGLVGESGCGKSTLISAVIRLMAENALVAAGEIRFLGQDMQYLSPPELRGIRGRDMSMVFQDPMTALNPVFTIGRQMVDIQYRDGVSKKAKAKRAADMLSLVGIPDAVSRLDNYPHHFSGGMCQRITIAMALLVQPKLLIADEPTTALDATLEVQIIRLLKELQADFQCAILFISHHLNVIAELCDFVGVMYAGELVEKGSVRDIFQRPAHPYTRALLECDPSVIEERTRFLPTIPGEIPSLIDLPEGCIFHDRCPKAEQVCTKTRPPEVSITEHHTALCHCLEV
ncbi:MAG: ABC transporter ATP-binding protein [Desulfobacteraceae bacterium]|nr:ABC transporter ATP-binding protein [Desulfobacteraceae bacterium]